MMLFFARTTRAFGRGISPRAVPGIVLAAAGFCLAVPGLAQTGAQQHGQVIYSRSTDENGKTATTAGPAANRPVPQMANKSIATDGEREAVTFTSFDMDVHLRPLDQHIAVRAQLTMRNDGKTPLAHIPLQISSSLNWEQIRVGTSEGSLAVPSVDAPSVDVPFQVATLNSDADHTGQLHEATVTLARPLAPGATLPLDVTYSGTIAANAQRLLAIGTPAEVALHSDWDEIGTEFTGLRGFGNVVWYPVSSVPVILGDGARLFDEMGEHKLRMAAARFRLRLAAEFPQGQAPTVALINGHPAQLSITPASDEVAGVATASVDEPELGFEAPSLFLAIRTPEKATDTTLWMLAGDESAVPEWADATAAVAPFLESWLGQQPRAPLTILDLPDPQDAPFETGAMLATSIRPADASELDEVMAHAMTHAWLCTSTESPPAWLSEGVAHFMGTLWIEKQSGKTKALESLEALRPALALIEPASPGVSAGQPLAAAISPIYYRTKAAYVFWMLRDVVGDQALSAALRAYNPAADTLSSARSNAGAGPFEKLLEQASTRRDLSWFFSDWVDADKGLPDLTIQKVFSEPAQAGNTLVAVTVANSGYAAAEVPVTVSTAATAVTQRALVPARGSITQRILIQGTPTRVQVNDGTVPETEASVHVTMLNAGPTGAPSSGSSSSSGSASPPGAALPQ